MKRIATVIVLKDWTEKNKDMYFCSRNVLHINSPVAHITDDTINTRVLMDCTNDMFQKGNMVSKRRAV